MSNEKEVKAKEFVQEFSDWRDGLKSETRGGITMYLVHGHYKWMNEEELFFYYLQNNFEGDNE